MKKIAIMIFLIEVCFGSCIDIGIMQSSASALKSVYKASDELLSKIILLVKSDMQASRESDDNALKNLLNIQNLDLLDSLNAKKIFFNTKMITELESTLIDNKAENAYFDVDKDNELQKVLK